MRRLHATLLAAGGALALLAGGTAAGAAVAAGPVDTSGAIHGCWTNAALNGSHVFVLQDAGTNCPKGTTAISWSQQGPAGPPGAQGPQGPVGVQGPKGDTGPAGPTGQDGSGATVATEPSGTNCANGGAKITDGSGNTAYACTGLQGPAGPQGPTGDTGDAGPQGPAGPSTAGPGGLDIITEVAEGGGSAEADCPASHPHVTGGGGLSPDAGMTDSQPVNGHGWLAQAPQVADVVYAYALCAQ